MWRTRTPWFGYLDQRTAFHLAVTVVLSGSDEDKFDRPTQKPIELMRRPMLNHTRRGELVYEPFLGSGTALAAAELRERVCYGMEIDPKYVDVVIKRWQKVAGKPAVRESDRRTFEEVAAERKVVAAEV